MHFLIFDQPQNKSGTYRLHERRKTCKKQWENKLNVVDFVVEKTYLNQ